jgi:hypothetical protein
MKFPISLLLLVSIPVAATAISCGGPLTEPCLGEKDKRYDKKASNALKDQAPVFKIFEGFFFCTQLYYDGVTGLPVIGVDPTGGDSSFFPSYFFMNQTHAGSRSYVHRINLYENLVAGGEGRTTPVDGWATSTYEKDGTAMHLGSQIGYGDTFSPAEQALLTHPVDDRTTYISGGSTGGALFGFFSQLYVCLDDECDQLAGNEDTFVTVNGVSVRFSQSVLTCNKLSSGEEWVEAIEDAYTTYNVPEADQVTVPMTGQCLTGACPTEEDWCKTDPECSVSPYQEPDASVESGAIAGFTIAGIVLLIALLYGLHVWRTKQQERRYKTKFAKRMADTISLRASMRQLTPEALASEFKKIDSETEGGYISKEGLWNFLSTGKAGDLSESDFNALFAAIDLDQSGTVDFLEFCTFMGKCSDEYRSARGNRGSIADRASRRISVADTAARRLSSVAPGSDDAAKAVTMEDAVKAAALEAGKDEQEEEE